MAGAEGKCGIAARAIISSYCPHFGEKASLVGKQGSGTIFFAHCNLHCVFCQNYNISQLGEGRAVDADGLARIMLSLQEEKCHNINLVSPTHVVHQILEAVEIAVAMGLHLPLVYNSGGYDSTETLRLLDGVVDIYMPDMKYSEAKIAEQLSGVKDYPEVNEDAVREMHRQVGDLQIDDQGVAQRGLIVRHLVLPDRLAGTEEVVRFLAQEVSTNTYVNIMAQYHPCYKAFDILQLSRPIDRREFNEAIDLAIQYGLSRLDSPRPAVPVRFILG